MASGPWRHRGLLLAGLVAATTLGWAFRSQPPPLGRFDRYHLPAFDPYVYVAMAEQPQYFTVAPWGYRILTPVIARLTLARNPFHTFRALTFVGLVLAACLLFLFLRRLGNGEWASLLAVAAFSVSGPIADALEAPVLGEPVTLVLELAFLLGLESGAGLVVFSLLAALMAYGKELFVLLLPLAYGVARRRLAPGRALLATIAAGLPSIFVSLVLRFWWTPHLSPPHAALTPELGLAAWQALLRSDDLAPSLLLGGLVPLAFAGSLRGRARPFLFKYGYLIAATTAMAWLAWLNIPSRTPTAYFGSNVRRLLVYAWPLLAPLALLALDRVWPHIAPADTLAPRRPVWGRLAFAGVLLTMLFPFAALDRYRRTPLHSERDGLLVLTLCRESLKAARQLARGETVSFDLDAASFDPLTNDASDAGWMRWYLTQGWGSHPQYGSQEARMADREASLLLPVLEPGELDLFLTLSASGDDSLDVLVNGVRAASLGLGTSPNDHAIRVDKRLLYRGDNVVTLVRQAAVTPGPRLHAIEIRPLPRVEAGQPGRDVTVAGARTALAACRSCRPRRPACPRGNA